MQVLAHNLSAQFSGRQLNINTNNKSKSAEKLSSGYRINRSADDAAGLMISEKMRWQVKGLDRASDNIQDGVSLCEVADGALAETHEILQRINELAIQASNDTNTQADRQAIQREIADLVEEINRIANDTSFNDNIYPLRYDSTSSPGGTSSSSYPYSPNTLTDSDYPAWPVQIIDNNTLPSLRSWQEGNITHYVLPPNQKYEISSNITNAIFEASGTTCIQNSHLQGAALICADGTDLYVNNVSFDNSNTNALQDKYTLLMSGTGTLNCFGDNQFLGYYTPRGVSAITYAIAGHKLTINGTSTSTLDAGKHAPPIYTNNELTINGGTINASYDDSVEWSTCLIARTLTINGGIINVRPHANAGGISAYSSAYPSLKITGGEININDLPSTSPHVSPAISFQGSMEISGGTLNINSTGKAISVPVLSAHTLNITGGSFNATSNNPSSSVIGNSYDMQSVLNINISGGDVTVKSTAPNEAIKMNTGVFTSINGTPVNTAGTLENGYNVFRYPESQSPTPNPPTPVTPAVPDTVIDENQGIWIQAGCLGMQGIRIPLVNATASALAIADANVETYDSAQHTIALAQNAIQRVSAYRTSFGVIRNRLEHAQSVDDITSENTQYSESKIRDTDMGDEIVAYSKHSILEQASQAMLAQANQSKESILGLFS